MKVQSTQTQSMTIGLSHGDCSGNDHAHGMIHQRSETIMKSSPFCPRTRHLACRVATWVKKHSVCKHTVLVLQTIAYSINQGTTIQYQAATSLLLWCWL